MLVCGLGIDLVIFWLRMWLLFALCHKSLPEVKVKRLSKQPSIGSIMCLLVFMLIKTNDEKEQVKQGNTKKNVKFEEKSNTRK